MDKLKAEFRSELLSNALSAGLALLGITMYLGYFALLDDKTPTNDISFWRSFFHQDSPDTTRYVLRYVPLVSHLFWLRNLNTLNIIQLMVPSQRDSGGIPVTPFALSTLVMGAVPILAYGLLSRGSPYPQRLPPAKSQLEGRGNWLSRVCECNLLPSITIVLGGILLVLVFKDLTTPLPFIDKPLSTITADADGSPRSYLKPMPTDQIELFKSLVQSSRLVRWISYDLGLQLLLAPLYLNPDSSLRRWALRKKVVPLLYFLPVVGPALYLIWRPKTFSWPFQPTIPEPLPQKPAQSDK